MNRGLISRLALVLALIPSVAAQAADAVLDRQSAELCMDVAVQARVTGLEDFELVTEEKNGSSGARYSGTDMFEVESNAPIRLIVNGTNLSNGISDLDTQYLLDGQQGNVETGNGVHNAIHSIEAQTALGDISDQLAGQYTAQVSITVVPLIGSSRSCLNVGSGVSGNQESTSESSSSTITMPVNNTRPGQQSELEQLESSINALDSEEQQQLLEFAQEVLSNNGEM